MWCGWTRTTPAVHIGKLHDAPDEQCEVIIFQWWLFFGRMWDQNQKILWPSYTLLDRIWTSWADPLEQTCFDMPQPATVLLSGRCVVGFGEREKRPYCILRTVPSAGYTLEVQMCRRTVSRANHLSQSFLHPFNSSKVLCSVSSVAISSVWKESTVLSSILIFFMEHMISDNWLSIFSHLPKFPFSISIMQSFARLNEISHFKSFWL